MKSKGAFAKGVLLFSFTFIILYTIAVLLGTYITGISEPSSLTMGVFGFFSVEAVTLMTKKLKEKDGATNGQNNNFDDINDNECGGIPDEYYSRSDQGVGPSEGYSDESSSVGRSPVPRKPWYLRIFGF